MRHNPPAKKLVEKLAKMHGKGKALSILAHKLARAIYYMLKNNVPFNRGEIPGNGIELEGTGAARMSNWSRHGVSMTDDRENEEVRHTSANRSLCRYPGQPVVLDWSPVPLLTYMNRFLSVSVCSAPRRSPVLTAPCVRTSPTFLNGTA